MAAAIGESVPGILFVLDKQGCFLVANRILQSLVGFGSEAFRGTSMIEVIAEEDRGLWSRGIRGIRPNSRATMTVRLLAKDGRKVPFLLTVLSTALDGEACLVGTGIDQTELLEAREARHVIESRFREIYENALEGMFQTTLEGKFVSANPALARFLGFGSVDEMIRHTDNIGGQLYANPEDRQRIVSQILAEGLVRNREIKLRRQDGTTMWGLLNQWIGGPALLEGFIVDISERKLAEAELQQNEEKYRSLYNQFRGIIDAMPDAMCLISRDLRIVWANDVAAANMRMGMREFLGKHCYESRHGFSAPCPNCIVLESYGSGKPVGGEGTTLDGRAWELHALPVLGDDGKVTGVIEAARDITERKKAEAEQQKLQAQFAQAQKMESVGRLAGGVAHDFSNMLTVILGQTELALSRLDPQQPLFADLQSIRRVAERSTGLTRQLLAFARKQTVAPKVLELNEVVEGMFKMLQQLIGEGIDLNWLPAEGLWPVKIDPSQVDQILANLCINARDAIGDNGKVTIETRNVTLDESHCSINAGIIPGDYVELVVSDDGCGMDAETMSHIFEPFFTTKEEGKGTGLGLATIFGIVSQNHGAIHVYSEPGRGTTFRIYLPRYAANAAVVQKAETAGNGKVVHGTILVVEDEPAILSVVKIMLERQNFTVLTASSPEEAIRLGAEHGREIDLLLTDVVLPGMNGRDLFNQLRVLHQNLKPLFMSGYSAKAIAHHGMLDEGVHFIAKPFSSADLIAKVKETISDGT
ncbi:MAG: PAS domain S-box protein [Kiritimatiellae bacterium]|nr:PAS domain S-box protein [Kiritimatiellia bacterium]